MDFFSAMIAEREQDTIRQERLADNRIRTISGTGEASIADVVLLNDKGRPVEVLETGTPVTLKITVDINTDLERLVLGFMIKDRMGQPIYGINTHRINRPLENLKAGEQVTYSYRFDANLGKGNYSVALSLSRLDSHLDKNYEWRDFALIFHVINTRKPEFVGCASLDAQLDIDRRHHVQGAAADALPH